MPSLEEDVRYVEWMMDVNLMHDSKARFHRILNELRGSSVAERGLHEPQVAGSIPAPATNQQEQA